MAAVTRFLRNLLRFRVALGAVLVSLSSMQMLAQEAPAPIESTKADFLCRFLEYIEKGRESSSGEPFTIAVLGDASLAEELHEAVRERKPLGRDVRTVGIRHIAQGARADLLFISSSAARRLGRLDRIYPGRPILVVTETADGLARGAVINFVTVDGRLRFEVSLPEAEQRGIKLSSRLLAIATRVEQSGKRVSDAPSHDGRALVAGEVTGGRHRPANVKPAQRPAYLGQVRYLPAAQ